MESEPQRTPIERLLVILFIALLVGVVGVLFQLSHDDEAPVVPEFALSSLDGGMWDDDGLQGEITVLNFFATWCGPCVQEMPELVRFYDSHRGTVRLLGVSAGYDDVKEVRDFAGKHGARWPILLGGEVLLGRFGTAGLPTTVILDAESRVRWIWTGPVDRAQLEDAIAELDASP